MGYSPLPSLATLRLKLSRDRVATEVMECQNIEDLPTGVNGMAQHRMLNSLVVSGSTRRPAKTLMIPLFSGKACVFMDLLMAPVTNFSSLKAKERSDLLISLPPPISSSLILPIDLPLLLM